MQRRQRLFWANKLVLLGCNRIFYRLMCAQSLRINVFHTLALKFATLKCDTSLCTITLQKPCKCSIFFDHQRQVISISDPRVRQWLHQRLSLAVVRGNTASIMACVQVWYDFSHPQFISQCSCPSLAFLQWIAIAFQMSVFSVSFIVFSMFFMLSVKPLCSIVLLPFSAILTNLILFIFHVLNTTVLLFTVKPFRNLPLPLSAQPQLGVLCAWSNTHTMAVLHHGLFGNSIHLFEKKKNWGVEALFGGPSQQTSHGDGTEFWAVCVLGNKLADICLIRIITYSGWGNIAYSNWGNICLLRIIRHSG